MQRHLSIGNTTATYKVNNLMRHDIRPPPSPLPNKKTRKQDRSPFSPGPVYVTFVVEKLALRPVFFPQYFCIPLAVSFHRCSTLIHSSSHTLHNISN